MAGWMVRLDGMEGRESLTFKKDKKSSHDTEVRN